MQESDPSADTSTPQAQAMPGEQVLAALAKGQRVFVRRNVAGARLHCATLNEHSSCQQFDRASSDTQTQVLQDMMSAHHDQESISTVRFLLTLYCNIEGPSAPIHGIYSGGTAG